MLVLPCISDDHEYNASGQKLILLNMEPMITSKQFIEDAVERGIRDGLTSLNPLEAFVFLISEAEVCCDMDGIDTFLERYGKNEVLLAAEAFMSVGAMEISEGLTRIGIGWPEMDEAQLNQINDLITDRAGYDYEAIESMVAMRLM